MAKKLKRLWRKVRCWLSGGHTYADINLKTERFPENGVTCFINQCLKCGKYQVYAVNDKALYSAIPLPERVEVDFDGK